MVTEFPHYRTCVLKCQDENKLILELMKFAIRMDRPINPVNAYAPNV